MNDYVDFILWLQIVAQFNAAGGKDYKHLVQRFSASTMNQAIFDLTYVDPQDPAGYVYLATESVFSLCPLLVLSCMGSELTARNIIPYIFPQWNFELLLSQLRAIERSGKLHKHYKYYEYAANLFKTCGNSVLQCYHHKTSVNELAESLLVSKDFIEKKDKHNGSDRIANMNQRQVILAHFLLDANRSVTNDSIEKGCSDSGENGFMYDYAVSPSAEETSLIGVSFGRHKMDEIIPCLLRNPPYIFWSHFSNFENFIIQTLSSSSNSFSISDLKPIQSSTSLQAQKHFGIYDDIGTSRSTVGGGKKDRVKRNTKTASPSTTFSTSISTRALYVGLSVGVIITCLSLGTHVYLASQKAKKNS